MPSPELAKKIHNLLMSYSGPEPDLVRDAIVQLSSDDITKVEHFLTLAVKDHQQVIAESQRWKEDQDVLLELQGMTVNERLFSLNLLSKWDLAIADGDRKEAYAILKKCALSEADIEVLLRGYFGT